MFENAIDESEKQAQEKIIGKFNNDHQSPPQDHQDDTHAKSKSKLTKSMKTIVKNLILAALVFVPGLIICHIEGPPTRRKGGLRSLPKMGARMEWEMR